MVIPLSIQGSKKISLDYPLVDIPVQLGYKLAITSKLKLKKRTVL